MQGVFTLLGDKRAHSWDPKLVQTHGVLPFLTWSLYMSA